MSANNYFDLVKMSNGEYWLLNRNWDEGAVRSVLAKCKTFSGLRRAIDRVANTHYFECGSDSDRYMQRALSRKDWEELEKAPVECWTHSFIDLRIAGRLCQCARESEITAPRWRVTEEGGNGKSRIIGDRLTFAQAYECANSYVVQQPGDVRFYREGIVFRHFSGPGDKHDCRGHETAYEQVLRRRVNRRHDYAARRDEKAGT